MTLSKTESLGLKRSSETSVGRTACGIFLVVLSAYVLSSPGRIDIIDGQARFDVAYNWLHSGKPILTDPWIKPLMAVSGRYNLPYSNYGAPASVFPMPLMALGSLYDSDMGVGTSQFLFCLTSSIFGAIIASVLFLFYIELELSIRQAAAWALITSFTTLIWPASTSTFDNAQHAFFAIASAYLGLLSTKYRSRVVAAFGGLLAGVLVLYQPYFLILIPALAISTIRFPAAQTDSSRPNANATLRARFFGEITSGLRYLKLAVNRGGEARESCKRYICFIGAIGADLVLSGMYNNLRFGSFWNDGKLSVTHHLPYPLFGNPVVGLLTLLVSPGKSILLYSPPLILGFFGFRSLRRRKPELAAAVLVTTVVLTLFISSISFVGGDWCWGPRYLVVLLPLWALSFPFAWLDGTVKRRAIYIIASLGLTVQLLAVSVENQRFFFERGFNDFFWAEDRWCYFKHSALFARVKEVASLTHGLPAQATLFNPIPESNWYTYTILGPSPKMSRSLAPQWMLHFKVFYLPRPWPFWMAWTNPDLRPIKPDIWVWTLLASGLIGVILVRPALTGKRPITVAENARLELGARTI